MKTRDFLKMVTFAALAPVPVLALEKKNPVNPEYHYITQQLQKAYPDDTFHEQLVMGMDDINPRISILMNKTHRLGAFNPIHFSEINRINEPYLRGLGGIRIVDVIVLQLMIKIANIKSVPFTEKIVVVA